MLVIEANNLLFELLGYYKHIFKNFKYLQYSLIFHPGQESTWNELPLGSEIPSPS